MAHSNGTEQEVASKELENCALSFFPRKSHFPCKWIERNSQSQRLTSAWWRVGKSDEKLLVPQVLLLESREKWLLSREAEGGEEARTRAKGDAGRGNCKV